MCDININFVANDISYTLASSNIGNLIAFDTAGVGGSNRIIGRNLLDIYYAFIANQFDKTDL